jgi:hypothetical protein
MRGEQDVRACINAEEWSVETGIVLLANGVIVLVGVGIFTLMDDVEAAEPGLSERKTR